MTLKELQNYHAFARYDMFTHGGEKFPAGTEFEILFKHGTLTLIALDGRWIRHVSFSSLNFDHIPESKEVKS
jgi:hypothetical protein